MAAKPLPPQSVLLQLLRYEPETGELFWKERGPEWIDDLRIRNTWNARYAGKPALNSINSDGYRIGSICGSNYKAQRVIWKMVTGDDPDQIDHENRVRTDNRFKNLRDVSLGENNKNRSLPANNKSGVIGVYLWDHNGFQYWAANLGGKKNGYFKTFDEAVCARRAAEVQHGFHPTHGRN